MTSKKNQETDHQDLLHLDSEEAENFNEIYSNYAEVGGSAFDIELSFYEIQRDNSGKLYKTHKSRVLMSPQSAIIFLSLLKETVADWKEEFGNQVKEILEEQ